MDNMIRCPACRGMKKVPKLGGMIGECNTCKGVGQIKDCDKPKPVIVDAPNNDIAIIKSVADCVPSSTIKEVKEDVLPEEPTIKVDRKKAIYKRKKG